MTRPIPEGYHTLTPYLSINNAAEAIDFYKEAFDAKEITRVPTPDGRIGHAELKIGDSQLMISDSFERATTKSPQELHGTTGGVFMYVKDVDSTFKKAVNAGAVVTTEVQDMFWGDRFASVLDPYGHSWSIATHTRDLSQEEIAEGSKKAMASMV